MGDRHNLASKIAGFFSRSTLSESSTRPSTPTTTPYRDNPVSQNTHRSRLLNWRPRWRSGNTRPRGDNPVGSTSSLAPTAPFSRTASPTFPGAPNDETNGPAVHPLSSVHGQDVLHTPYAWGATTNTVNSWKEIVITIGNLAGFVATVGEVHPLLKTVTAVISGIAQPIVKQDVRDDNFRELLQEMKLVYDHVIRTPGTIKLPKKRRESRQTSLLKDICEESHQCALFIQKEYTRNFWFRAARNAFNGDKVDEEIEKYRSSFARLNAKWESEARNYMEGGAILMNLSPMRGGQTSQRACLPDTRIEVRTSIQRWIDTSDVPRAMFLLGVAGSGKSSIAHTVAMTADERAQIGSFVAFNRNDATRVPERLLGTIAHQLAHWSEEYRDRLVGILREDPTLADSPDIMKQWKWLIVEPAAAISSPGPVLLVIDAFDECPEPSDGSRQRLLECLTRRVAELPDQFRVLVTSRPPDKVSQALNAPSVGKMDLSDYPAVEDIRRYVRRQLPPPEKAGLSDRECNEITDAADGLFQWAATACRFLGSRLGGTTMSAKFSDNLQRLIHGDPGPAHRDGPPSLDALYSAVLQDTFEARDLAAMSNFRSAVALMLCAKVPLSIAMLQSIYDQVEHSRGSALQSVLGSMGVVLEGASSINSPVRPMHLSFREFLLDRARSDLWHISTAEIAEGHRILALGGLRMMSSQLRFNMHRLPSSLMTTSSTWRRANVPDCQTALTYSISNLHRHLKEMQLDSYCAARGGDLRLAIRDLLYQKFIFWLEWLSIREEHWAALETLNAAQKILTGDDLLFAKDALLFLSCFWNTITDSPAHIYLSALPFAPANSLVRSQFISQFPGLPSVTPVPDSWTAYERPAAAILPRVAWSTDGLYIREDRERLHSRCWDARTGMAVDLPPNLEWRYPSHRSTDGGVNASFMPLPGRKTLVHVDTSQPSTPELTFALAVSSGGTDETDLELTALESHVPTVPKCPPVSFLLVYR